MQCPLAVIERLWVTLQGFHYDCRTHMLGIRSTEICHVALEDTQDACKGNRATEADCSLQSCCAAYLLRILSDCREVWIRA